MKENKRKKNTFRFIKEEALRDIYKIKEEFNSIGIDKDLPMPILDLLKYPKGLESLSNIISLDLLILFSGTIYSIRDNVFEEKLNRNNFNIKFEDGVKLKIPFIMKKGVGTPLYYLDIAKKNISIYKKIKEKIIENNIDIDLTEFDNIFNISSYRKINISQQTFLLGYSLGFLYKVMDFDDFYTFIKEEYKSIHNKHGI